MPRTRSASTATVLSLLLCSCVPAEADPITTRYNVTIRERCFRSFQDCLPFTATFPLTLTFDGGVTFLEESPQGSLASYGRPTFSIVPLARPPVAPNASADGFTSDSVRALEPPASPWSRFGVAQGGFDLEADGVSYS